MVGFAYDMSWRPAGWEENVQNSNSERVSSAKKTEKRTHVEERSATPVASVSSAPLPSSTSGPAKDWADIEIPDDLFARFKNLKNVSPTFRPFLRTMLQLQLSKPKEGRQGDSEEADFELGDKILRKFAAAQINSLDRLRGIVRSWEVGKLEREAIKECIDESYCTWEDELHEGGLDVLADTIVAYFGAAGLGSGPDDGDGREDQDEIGNDDSSAVEVGERVAQEKDADIGAAEDTEAAEQVERVEQVGQEQGGVQNEERGQVADDRAPSPAPSSSGSEMLISSEEEEEEGSCAKATANNDKRKAAPESQDKEPGKGSEREKQPNAATTTANATTATATTATATTATATTPTIAPELPLAEGKRVDPPPAKSIKCGYCSKMFNSRSMHEHIQTVHRKGRSSVEVQQGDQRNDGQTQSQGSTSAQSASSEAKTPAASTNPKPKERQRLSLANYNKLKKAQVIIETMGVKVTVSLTELAKRVAAFKGKKEDKEYRLLKEKLTGHMMSVYSLDAKGDAEVRKLRKDSMDSINKWLTMLDSKAEEPNDTEDPTAATANATEPIAVSSSSISSSSAASTTSSATGEDTSETPILVHSGPLKIPLSVATSLPEIDILVRYDNRTECPESKVAKVYKYRNPSVIALEMKGLAGIYRRFYESFVDKEFDKTLRVSILQGSTVFAVAVNKSDFAAGPPGLRRSVLLHVGGEPGRGCAVSLVVEDKSPKSIIGMSVEGRKPVVFDRKVVRKFFGGVGLTAASTVTRQSKMILRLALLVMNS